MGRYIIVDNDGIVTNTRIGPSIVEGEIESEYGDIGQKMQLDGSFVDVTPVLPLDALKEKKLNELNLNTQAALSKFQYKGLTLELGAKVDTNIIKFRAMGHMTPDRSVQWQALDGTFGPDDSCSITVTLEERLDLPGSVTIDQLDMDITMYEYGISAQKGIKLVAIREAKTPEELDSIVVDYYG